MLGEKLWDFDVEKEKIYRYYHMNSQNQREFKSVQIKSIKGKKREWEKYPYDTLEDVDISGEFEELLFKRRTRRVLTDTVIDDRLISKFLKLSFGKSDLNEGYSTYPSPGALFPTMIYMTINTEKYRNKLLRYNPYNHGIEYVENIDSKLMKEVIISDELKEFPVVFYLATDYELLNDKYGELSYRLVCQETGHIAQNISLVAEYLKLNSVCLGGYYEYAMQGKAFEDKDLLYVIVVG